MSDEVITSAVATVQAGVARADGKLSLTDSDVTFELFNQQFGLGPNRFLRNDITSGKRCEFIVAGPSQWIERLSEKAH
ncbi:hypothetical protein [Ferrimonas balearica]|uniref:hypothetical protein n=1 Tax=Ferrimonas balearica TaxID=44012 RepID=UPI001C998F0A|nr:hypothetical protein [Ferrimonas balearica]MBY5921442.1 hypothetical protein [Ferrimonas balearica]MBY5995873.1 hypothetical protein [Ferrimonas balearica]